MIKSISEIEAYIESLPEFIKIDFDYRNTVEALFRKQNNLNLDKSFSDFTKWYTTKNNVKYFDEHKIDSFTKMETLFTEFFAQFNSDDKAKEYFNKLGLKCEYIWNNKDKELPILISKGFEILNITDFKGYGNIIVFDLSKPKIKFNTAQYDWDQENALKYFYSDDSIKLESKYSKEQHSSNKGTFKMFSYGFELDHTNTKEAKEEMIRLIKDIYKDRPLAR